MAGERVTLEVRSSIATITLADPARRNALSAELNLALAGACREARRRSDVKAVVLTGAGPAFCAGGDAATLNEPGRSLPDLYAGLDALVELSVPVIAAVNGPAIGAGMGLALACDLIVCSRSARFEAPFLDIGIHPGGGFLWRLAELVGTQAAAALVLFGASVSAQRAKEIRLVWDVVDDEELLGTASALAGRAARRSGALTRRTKANLRTSAAVTHRGLAVELELAAQQWSMQQPAFHEGVERLRRRLADRGPQAT